MEHIGFFFLFESYFLVSTCSNPGMITVFDRAFLFSSYNCNAGCAAHLLQRLFWRKVECSVQYFCTFLETVGRSHSVYRTTMTGSPQMKVLLNEHSSGWLAGQKSYNRNAAFGIWCQSLIFTSVSLVWNAVRDFAAYKRCFASPAVWFCELCWGLWLNVTLLWFAHYISAIIKK